MRVRGETQIQWDIAFALSTYTPERRPRVSKVSLCIIQVMCWATARVVVDEERAVGDGEYGSGGHE